ncbi:hypothetical protein [Methylomonas albis]|nr:hypothetical protein [Methylomonas albis]
MTLNGKLLLGKFILGKEEREFAQLQANLFLLE